jgi:hypothetical protein
VDFRNTVVIMTSNLGSQTRAEEMQEQIRQGMEAVKGMLPDEMADQFNTVKSDAEGATRTMYGAATWRHSANTSGRSF